MAGSESRPSQQTRHRLGDASRGAESSCLSGAVASALRPVELVFLAHGECRKKKMASSSALAVAVRGPSAGRNRVEGGTHLHDISVGLHESAVVLCGNHSRELAVAMHGAHEAAAVGRINRTPLLRLLPRVCGRRGVWSARTARACVQTLHTHCPASPPGYPHCSGGGSHRFSVTVTPPFSRDFSSIRVSCVRKPSLSSSTMGATSGWRSKES